MITARLTGTICKPNFSISSPSLKMTEQKGFGRMPTCAMRMPRKFLTMQATAAKRSKPSANAASSTRQVLMNVNGMWKRCIWRLTPKMPHWLSV